MTTLVRTSITDPIRIDAVTAPCGSGQIGMTLCPGRRDRHSANGEWARDLDSDLDVVAAWKPDVLVTLLEHHEFEELGIPDFPMGVAARDIPWMHLPIADGGVPNATFERAWQTAGLELRQILSRGGRILVHCRAGLGRTGTIAARLLVELGLEADTAIKLVRTSRTHAIERGAQERHVRSCRTAVAGNSDGSEDRALGCLLGLAIGDALGTTIEFRKRDTYAHLTDIVGGGPFSLKPGEWTDDTSMALCLAESIIAFPDLNERDLMNRFVRWRDRGENSVNGLCFDIGAATTRALDRYLRTDDPISGSTRADTAGNGSLMRLAPIALRWLRTPDLAMSQARRQSATTHAADAAIEACAFFAERLTLGIRTGSRSAVLAPSSSANSSVNAVAIGSWKRERSEIRSSGYVIDTLEAAFWAVSQASSFTEAVLLAANLGNDADTVGAVTGQLAGAIWGLSDIPERWLTMLAERERIEDLGRRLIALGAG
jgi:ADP-ribosyl-[dinitrogen reductase] hydrolase